MGRDESAPRVSSQFLYRRPTRTDPDGKAFGVGSYARLHVRVTLFSVSLLERTIDSLGVRRLLPDGLMAATAIGQHVD